MTDEDLKEVHQQQQQPGKSWWSGLASMKQSIVTIASSKLPIGVGSIEAIDGPAVTRTPMPEKVRLDVSMSCFSMVNIYIYIYIND